MPPAWVPLLILLVTYALLSVQRLPRFGARRHRAWVALAGGLAMLATGAVALGRAAEAVDLGILALLFGMLTLAAALEVAGFFEWLARRVVERARTPRQLLAATMVAAAILSALFLNDAVVLLFTPVLVKAARLLQADPMPYLAGEAFAANIGSVATPVGNPQNAYIAFASGIPFLDYVAVLLPVAAASLLVGLGLTLALFRRSLAKPLDKAALAALPPAPLAEPRLLAATVAVLAAVFAGFLLGPRLGANLAHVAFAGGLAVLVLALVLAPRSVPQLARRIDLTVLVFFVGLFWLIAGVREAGLTEALAGVFLGGGVALGPLAAWTALLSNVVSNVPAVLLIAPTVQATGSADLWLALAASSTLAGNATLLGAAANVIVAETARAHGAEFSVRRFMLAGVPVTLATLGLAVAMLALR